MIDETPHVPTQAELEEFWSDVEPIQPDYPRFDLIRDAIPADLEDDETVEVR